MRRVETSLGSPVFIGSDERTDKVRGHLIFAAAISLFVTVADLHFGSGSSFLGLEITGLTDHVAYIALLVFVGYQLVHYVWCAWDAFLEWRLRITGTRVAFMTGVRLGSKDGTTQMIRDSRRCITGGYSAPVRLGNWKMTSPRSTARYKESSVH